ncbi:MAG: hypothetical protein AB7I37_12175 [Pirellulales bacterium]
MTQRDLNRAVARATGEDLSEIERLGFNIIDPEIGELDDEPYTEQHDILPLTINWDEYDLHRNVAVIEQRQFSRAA